MRESTSPTSESPPDYTETALCIQCGYRLKGLSENRCPECGTEFDPRYPSTMNVPEPRLAWWPFPFGTKMLIAATVATYLCLSGLRLVPSGWVACLGGLTWVGVLVAWARRPSKSSEDRSVIEAEQVWRVRVVLLMILTLVVCPQFNHCVHGTTVGFGPVGLCYSRKGGPCFNGAPAGDRHLGGNWYVAYFFY